MQQLIQELEDRGYIKSADTAERFRFSLDQRALQPEIQYISGTSQASALQKISFCRLVPL
jgi:hypothetical protein